MPDFHQSAKKRRSFLTFLKRAKTPDLVRPPSPSTSSASSNEQVESTREVVSSSQLEESFDDWLRDYAESTHQGESVEAPPNFAGSGHKYCPAPSGLNESERAKAAVAAEKSGSWQQRPFYVSKLGRLIDRYNIQGLSVSSLLEDVQKVHYQYGVGTELKCVPKADSLDAHAALSPNGLQVPNTNFDWRFKQHPLVEGPPFVRYYYGFPVRSRDFQHVLGCIAIFSTFAKQAATQALVDDFRAAAKELSTLVDTEKFDFEPDGPSVIRAPIALPDSPPPSPTSVGVNSADAESAVYQALYSLPTSKPRALKPASPADKMAAKISKCATANIAIKSVCESLLLDLTATEVYIVEMCLYSTYICSCKAVDFASGTAVSDVKLPEKVFARPLTRNRARSRVAGRAALNTDAPPQSILTPEQLLNTLTAPIGLRIQFAGPAPLHVVAIPFARQDPIVTIANPDHKHTTSSSNTRMLEVDSGGFILVVAGDKRCSTAETAKIRNTVALLEPVIKSKGRETLAVPPPV